MFTGWWRVFSVEGVWWVSAPLHPLPEALQTGLAAEQRGLDQAEPPVIWRSSTLPTSVSSSHWITLSTGSPQQTGLMGFLMYQREFFSFGLLSCSVQGVVTFLQV